MSETLAEQITINKNNIVNEINTRVAEANVLSARIKVVEDNYTNNVDLNTHKENTENPHSVTAAQVGLNNVQNLPLEDEPNLDSPNYITSNAVAKVKADLATSINSHTSNESNPHKVTKEQIKAIAEYKMPDLNANDIDAAIKIVAGSARSMGVEVEE